MQIRMVLQQRMSKEALARHKIECKKTRGSKSTPSNSTDTTQPLRDIPCVKIFGFDSGGGRYEDVTIPSTDSIFSNSPLPVTVKFGYPLVMKRLYDGRDDNQHATWLAINPISGFAPPEWQNSIGSVIVANADRTPLSLKTLAAITDYISDILDQFGEDRPNVKRFYNRGRLDEYIREHVEMQERFQAEQEAMMRDGKIPG
jgi:hypothetical protein